jgi:hypothetical protein
MHDGYDEYDWLVRLTLVRTKLVFNGCFAANLS